MVQPLRPMGDGHQGGHPPPPPPRQRMFNAPPVTLRLCLAITAAFALIQVLPPAWERAVLEWGGLVPLKVYLALWAEIPVLESLAILASFFSHAFVHLDFIHFATNAGFLLAFGSAVERILGSKGFLTLFVCSVVAGGLAQLALTPEVRGLLLGGPEAALRPGAIDAARSVLIGASGGVSGAMGAAIRYMLIDPRHRRMALVLTALLVAMNAVMAVLGAGVVGADGTIAWQAHAGGFLAGFLIALFRRRRPMAVV